MATIKIGGLGQEVSCYCPVCSEKMSHWAIASKSVRYEYKCDSCELSLKSDRFGNAKLLKEMELTK
jgi:transposase-like protein